MLTKLLPDLVKGIIDLSVPAQCLMCDALQTKPGGCCPVCWQKIRFIRKPMCPVLGTPFAADMGEGILSAEAIADPPVFDKCRSAVIYDDHTRPMVTALKYTDRLDLAPWMANWMVQAGRELFEDDPVIIPVPLHPLRLIQRRFNQSAVLARHISKMTGLAFWHDVLTKRKNTLPQVGLNALERAHNVQGAFWVKEAQKIRLSGQKVVLIDDVYTSGATAKSASKALLRAGAKTIYVLTFARVESGESSAL